MHTQRLVSTMILFLASVNICLAEDKQKIPLLLDRSPAKANAIGYINVPSLNKLMEDAGFSSRVTTSIEEVWFIADLDIASFEPKWEAGYSVLKQPVDAQKLATSLGGYVDTVESRQVVHSPHQTYFVPGTEHPERLGILRPADRSLLAGWLDPTFASQYTAFLSAQRTNPSRIC